MNGTAPHVCPVERSGSLDNWLRRMVQHPERILAPYLREGMTALDFGCGPGFFTVPMARMVGKMGHVIACDLQTGMLEKVQSKIRGTELENRVHVHQAEQHSLGINEPVDFVLAFYVMHEVPDPLEILADFATILRPEGRVLVVEPPLHVSKNAFARFLETAHKTGYNKLEGPKLWFNKTALLEREKA
jgi:ubiquinone/menaquinone biosynthesis C-methylase UbiE